MKTTFDECPAAKPLQDKLWFSRGDPAFWTLLEVCDPRVCLHPPASDVEISKLREYAGGELPPTLENFLRHSNGLTFDMEFIVLPAENIIKVTQRIRQMDEALPNGHLLFIGCLGDGDMFAFAKNKKGEWLTDVFWWEHETESCYDCGLGIWGYVAKHVGWCHAVSDKPPEDPDLRAESAYRDKLRKLSGEAEIVPGMRRLISQILELRAKEDFEEMKYIDLLTEFLSQLTVADFRKIPIERLLRD